MPEGPPKPGESKPAEKKEEPKSPLELARETIEEKERARERKKEARKERWGETKEKAVEKGKIVFEKAGEFSEKAKEFLSNKEIQKQIGKTLVGTTATILGIKSIYDVPVYLRQRFKVRGVFGVGKGLKGSIEDIFSTSQKMHEKIQKKGFKDEQREVRDAIKDLNKRLTLTREGAKKGSEQRKLIAKILWENRIDEKTTKEERGVEIKKILDEYTTTKVTGMQATRESLNTAFVVAGAYGARAVSYGFLDGVERYQRLAKEARGKGERVSILKDVLVKGITETFQEARFKDLGDKEKTKIQRGLSAIGAWGKIARYVGIGATAVWIPGSENELVDKALDALSDKDTPGRVPDTKIEDIPKTKILLPFVEETPAPKDIEVLPLFKPNLEYQGGKSIWGEGERQLELRFKAFSALGGVDEKASEALKTYNIDRIKDTVVGDPQKYGLAAGVNVNKLTTEQLKNIKWDGAFKDTFGDKGLTKELSDEQIKGVLKSNQEELKDLRQRLTAAAVAEVPQRVTTEAPGLPPAVAGVGEVLAENPPPKDWSPDIKAEVIEKINANRVKFPNIVTDIQPVPEHESMVIVKFKPNPEAAARWVPEPGGPREVTPVIYSENGPVHILTEENIKTEMADGAKSMPEIAGKVMDRKVDEFNKTKEALIEKLVKGAAEVSPPIENVEEQLKEWNITPEGWGKEDQLKFWTEHPSLDKKELDTIFRFNSQSGNTLSCDVIKKYLDSGFIESSKGLSDNRLVDLMKVFEHPDTAKFPLVNLIGENWTKKDLFNAVEWEIEDNKLKISFDVKDNFTDVDLIIYENGTIAVDGHGFQNWNLGKPVPLTDENLRAAMGFINKTDGTGAVSISQESLQGEP